MAQKAIENATRRLARLNETVRDIHTKDLFTPPVPRRFSVRPKLTPAWVVHRQNLSDRTKPQGASRSVLKNLAEASFKRWHEECQKRKERKQVMVAKGLKPGKGKSATPPQERKPPSRLRCP